MGEADPLAFMVQGQHRSNLLPFFIKSMFSAIIPICIIVLNDLCNVNANVSCTSL